MASGDKTVDFENQLRELENLAERLEEGEMSLEESLQAFERGVRLTRECQQALSAAELRVQALIEENGRLIATPLTEDGDPPDDDT